MHGLISLVAALLSVQAPRSPHIIRVHYSGHPETVYAAASNFPRDLYGPIDTRPDTWGHADADILPITFLGVPAGKHVRLLWIHGDLTSAIRVLPGESPALIGSSAGTLVGLQSTNPGGDETCTYCANNTALYRQDVVAADRTVARLPFDENLDFLLESDATLLVKIAEFLNTTEHAIHLEATFVVHYSVE